MMTEQPAASEYHENIPGPPCVGARYEILRSCVAELLRTGIVHHGALPLAWDAALAAQELSTSASSNGQQPSKDEAALSTRLLLDVAAACEGASGRLLRKLPLLTHAAGRIDKNDGICAFLAAMKDMAAQEAADRAMLSADHLAR